MSHTKPPYSAQFRQQMVELAQAGRSASELSREFGPHVTSILNWVRKAKEPDDSPMGAQPPLNASERQELVALRRKVKQPLNHAPLASAQATTHVVSILTIRK